MVDPETGEQANIIISNHVSYMDILLLMTNSSVVPGFVSKVEVKKIPIIGWYSQCWQCLYVDRTVEGGLTSKIIERASDTRKQSQ
jgi:1-acyl-sn-glycerol-3-phosphate acyltransferase